MNLSEFATEIAEQLREKMGSKFTITVEEVLNLYYSPNKSVAA